MTTHLPKLLTFTLPLLLLGIMVDLRFWSLRNPSSGLLLLPAAHVALLSALGHKEWRFIVYVIPCLNGVAAVGLSWA